MTTTSRPGLGNLEPGQPVMVRRSPSNMRGRRLEDQYVPAVVVKASRVWIDLERSDLERSTLGHQTWRMRRDTQNEGSNYSSRNAYFFTLDQYAWDEALKRARNTIFDNGIRLDSGSRWIGREVELADLLNRELFNKEETE